ncbi:hypothetical protein LR48_Vigan05g125300 [Vigna angularis]|uniref:Uncharacterized protein n=1 Tax=Phaseolus angularis TaxID=3914 RepID=A0A0L9ULL6_PHAAN|nr:hypothetical protein LR48_Vigan05g125300 [Vigna angularis]
MTTLVQFSIKCSLLKPKFFHDGIYKRPTFPFSRMEAKVGSFSGNSLKLREGRENLCFLGSAVFQNGVLLKDKGSKREKRMVAVRNNQGFGFNGGGGGRDDGATARLLGNIALAVGLTYLSVTGQLGWILDAIVSIWLIAVLIPIVGVGAFLWWAGRDIMQGTCPNCGNDFQVFKSSLNDDLQLCPFCGQPFSVLIVASCLLFLTVCSMGYFISVLICIWWQDPRGGLRALADRNGIPCCSVGRDL